LPLFAFIFNGALPQTPENSFFTTTQVLKAKRPTNQPGVYVLMQ